jgi:hypothetical protein
LVQFERQFRLLNKPGAGVCCDENGLFVGEAPLLERARGPGGRDQWRPRSLVELNRDLSECYGLPVEFTSKVAGLAAVTRALERGDVVHAQNVALHLQLPDPPTLAKSAPDAREVVDLARWLQASGLLKVDWNPAKHPRWPAESPGGVGGQFAPAGAAGPSAILIPAQATIPAPLDIPIPDTIPFPPEIVVPPPFTPNIAPREAPRNPYPDRPECVEEWADAYEYCKRLKSKGKLGRDGYRGMGNTFSQCVRGQVSESCGENSLEA